MPFRYENFLYVVNSVGGLTGVAGPREIWKDGKARQLCALPVRVQKIHRKRNLLI